MCDEINISLINAELAITNFKEGDIVVIKIKRNLSNCEFERIEKYLKEKYPDIQFMILDDGIDIEVLRKEE